MPRERGDTARIQYLQYPNTIGQSVKHWVSFSGFDFKSHQPTLDIALYIPGDALQTSYKSEYESVGLGIMGAAGSKAYDAITGTGDYIGGDDPLTRVTKMIKATLAAHKSEASAVTMIEATGLVTAVKGGAGAKTIMEQQQGAVLNPYITAAYKGPTDMRTHDFTFQMLPQTERESRTCVKIAKAFKRAMLPSHAESDSSTAPSMLFGYPDQFEIAFTVNGKQMPKTSMNPMFNIGRSVLTACDLDFTTESVALFFDNTQYPVSISMKLSFMELEVMHRGKIQKGF
jgi:hypothetical protein